MCTIQFRKKLHCTVYWLHYNWFLENVCLDVCPPSVSMATFGCNWQMSRGPPRTEVDGFIYVNESDASEATATHAVTSPIVSNCEQLLCWIRWVLRILEELIFSLLCSSQCNRYRHDTLLICVTDIFSITFLRQVQQNNKSSHTVRCLKFP